MKRLHGNPYSYAVLALITIVGLALAFGGCSKSTSSDNSKPPVGPTVVDQVSATVTSAGAELKLKNGIVLSIPVGAVSAPVNVNLAQLSTDSSFSASFQTVLRLELGSSLTQGRLLVPLDSNQRSDLVAAAFRPQGSNGAYPLAGAVDASGDTFIVDLASRTTPSEAAGWLEDVTSGTVVVERGASYTATRSQKIIQIPYYQQDGETCWATSLLMFLRSYTTVMSHDEIYKLLYLFGIERDAGIGWSASSALKEKAELLTGLKTEQNTWVSYNNFVDYCIKSLDDGKPVLTCVISHEIVICGYEIEGTGDNQTTYLIFHDPQSFGDQKIYSRWTTAQIRAKWWNQGLLGFTIWNFVTVTMTTSLPQAPRLQTVHLLGGDTLPALIVGFSKGLAFARDTKVGDVVVWDHRYASGLSLYNGTEAPRDLTALVLKQVPVWNADLANAVTMRIKTSLYHVQNGSFKIPSMDTNEKTQLIQPVTVFFNDATFQLTSIVDDLTVGDTLFAIEEEIFDQAGLRVDGFDVRFKWRPLRIKSLDPTSGKPGDYVTVEGIGFGKVRGTVTFNGASAEITSWREDQIVVKVPSEATSGNVVVTIGADKSNGVAFSAGSFIELLHKTKYPQVSIAGVFTHTSWTGYGLFSATYIWDTQLVWNGTSFGQHYTKSTDTQIETVSIDGTLNADGTVVTHLTASVREQQVSSGWVWEESVTELEIADLPLTHHSDDPGEFMAIFSLEKEQIAPKLSKLRYVRRDFNQAGNVTHTDSLVSANWLNPDHEGLIQMWFFEKGLN